MSYLKKEGKNIITIVAPIVAKKIINKNILPPWEAEPYLLDQYLSDNENIRRVNIEDFIPHREPMRLINEVYELKEYSGVTGAVVKSTWPLCDGDSVDSLVLIEAIGQTFALADGYNNKKKGKAIGNGWIVGIKSAEFKQSRIPVGTEIIISVKHRYSMDSYGVIDGSVKAGDDVLVVAVIQGIRMDDNDTVNFFV